VRPDELVNLSIHVLEPSTEHTFETRGRVDIEVSAAGDADAEDGCSILGSEDRAAVTGVVRREYRVESHNGALSEWTRVDSVKLENNTTFRFQVGRDCFLAPPGAVSRRLIKHFKAFPRSTLDVRMEGGKTFCFKIDGRGSCSVVGTCLAARKLPVAASPYAILGGGFEDSRVGLPPNLYVTVAEGRYFLPGSIRSQLVKVWSLDSDGAVNAFLNGKLVLHTASRFGRVQDSHNCEEMLSIVDSSGATLATNIYDGGKRQRR
jgi:hypothetical protein